MHGVLFITAKICFVLNTFNCIFPERGLPLEKVGNVLLSNFPTGNCDLVTWEYPLPAPKGIFSAHVLQLLDQVFESEQKK